MDDSGTEQAVGRGVNGLAGVSLIVGERVALALNAADADDGSSAAPYAMLLTDQRVIHVQGNGRRRKVKFVSIQDIDSAEVTYEPEGRSAFVWAGLAFVAALFIFLAIGNDIGRIVGAILVALMGIYLLVDRAISSGRPLVVLRAGSSEIRSELTDEDASSNIDDFINRLYELKAEHGLDGGYGRRPFAPR